MVKIIKSIIKEGQTNQRPAHYMEPKYITVHNTANSNKGANAEMHAKYLHNGASGRVVSWHFTVDDTEIYQHLPLNENGWHAGDGGSGTGNRESIGIEICENSDGAFGKAVSNAVWLIQKLMKEHNVGIGGVVTHKHWSGKNCPHKLLDQWQGFIKRVENSEAPSSKPANKPNTKTISQMVQEVIAGKHGEGNTNRQKSLVISDAEYAKVRAEVNKRVNAPAHANTTKTITQMAKEVIIGEHGKGHANRQRSLRVGDTTYQKVRAEVNKLSGGTTSKPKQSTNQMATRIINDPKAPKGHDARRKWLGVDNDTYQRVRAEVNKKM